MAKSDYNEKIAEEICNAIATRPEDLETLVAENPHWPKDQYIYKWVAENETFGRMYARARMRQCEVLLWDAMRKVRDASQDVIRGKGKDGTNANIINHAHMNRLRIEVDLIKWLASKLAPRIYGDRVTGDNKVTLTIDDTTRKTLDAENEYKREY